MDRVADGAIFGAVAYWLATEGDHSGLAAALICLVAGGLVSYVKARAEGLGMTCNVGIAERAERLMIVGVGGLLTGFGVTYGLESSLWLLAAVSIVTSGQRMATCTGRTRTAAPDASGGAASTRDRAVELDLRAGWRWSARCPGRAAWRSFRPAPTAPPAAAARVRPGSRANLRRVVGPDVPEAEFDELVTRGLRSYARYWLEAFRLPALSRASRTWTGSTWAATTCSPPTWRPAGARWWRCRTPATGTRPAPGWPPRAGRSPRWPSGSSRRALRAVPRLPAGPGHGDPAD